MRRIIPLFILLPFYLYANGQDSALLQQLLHRIAAQQTSNNNFPTYISNSEHFKTVKQDDNIFFAALINYTLLQQNSFLKTGDSLLMDSIRQKTSTLYPHFQNKKGRLSYNFWRTDTSFVFPYTWWIPLLKKNTALPDDMDDTVLSLMAQNADSARVIAVHGLMQAYISNNKNSGSIDKNYRSCKAYSVWFGKRFPAVYDVCVLSNVLCFVQQYHLRWTAADSVSLKVIVQSIKSNDFINKPLFVSPYYGNTSLILYHLSRLMSYGNIPELTLLQTKLVKASEAQFATSNELLEKVMLASAMMKWGCVPPPITLPENYQLFKEIETSDFAFFTGNIPSYFTSFYKRIFYKKQWLLFYHYCPAFNDALLLEYLVLKQQMK